jgi:hypothetical protein
MLPPNHTDKIAALQARLANLKGPARCRLLADLGATYAERYWRTGVGSPAARPDLDAAIDALNEAYGYLEVNDPFRGLIAGGLGQQLATRRLTHQSDGRDGETAIHLLEESLSFTDQPPMARMIAKFMLAQLLLGRATQAMQSALSDAFTLMRDGLPASATAEIERAERLLHEVADGATMNADLVNGARTMLPAVEAMKTMFGALGGGGGLDLNRMQQAMGAMQQATGRFGTFAAAYENSGANPFAGMPVPGLPFAAGGSGGMPPQILHAAAVAARAPLDYPVTVVTGSEPPVTEPFVPRPRDAVRVPELNLATARRDLRAAMRAAAPPATGDPDDLAPLARALLAAGALDRGVIDDLVARAAVIVDAPGATDADADPADRFLLGVALYLRARDDAAAGSDGWGDPVDFRPVATALLTAVADAPAGHPVAAAVPDVLHAAAGFGLPLRGVLTGSDRVPDPGSDPGPMVTDLAAAVRAVGADLLVRMLPADPPTGPVTMLALDPHTDRLDLVATFDPTDGPAFADAVRAELGHDGPRRLITVAGGPLARTAWAAARDSAGRHLADGVAVTHAGSCAEVVTLAGRALRPLTGAAVFVANPRGDRETAGVEAMLLRRLFHPGSTGLGRTVEHVDGIGTPAEVNANLATAAIVHLGCGVRRTGRPALELVTTDGPADLEITPGDAGREGGIVVLPADSAAPPHHPDEIAAALLAAGPAAVVGWLHPVPDAVAALMLMLLHATLVDVGAPPAQAVNAVQRWMLDPHRKPVDGVPPGHLNAVDGVDLTDPALWGALYHRGR